MPGPSKVSRPMWLMSNSPTRSRTALCSSVIVEYCTGISQPPNSTIRPLWAWCQSYSDVLRSGVSAMFKNPAFATVRRWSDEENSSYRLGGGEGSRKSRGAGVCLVTTARECVVQTGPKARQPRTRVRPRAARIALACEAGGSARPNHRLTSGGRVRTTRSARGPGYVRRGCPDPADVPDSFGAGLPTPPLVPTGGLPVPAGCGRLPVIAHGRVFSPHPGRGSLTTRARSVAPARSPRGTQSPSSAS